jgi:hypothetical protein
MCLDFLINKFIFAEELYKKSFCPSSEEFEIHLRGVHDFVSYFCRRCLNIFQLISYSHFYIRMTVR